MNAQNIAVLILSVFGIALAVILLFWPAIKDWRALSRAYPDQPFGAKANFYSVSGKIGSYGAFRRSLIVSIDSVGLRVAPWGLIARLLPPFFIPWSEIRRCSRERCNFSDEGLQLQLVRWPHPIYLYGFPWRYSDAPSVIEARWSEHTSTKA